MREGILEIRKKARKWEEIPEILVLLAEKTAGIGVSQFTRQPELWKDCRLRLGK